MLLLVSTVLISLVDASCLPECECYYYNDKARCAGQMHEEDNSLNRRQLTSVPENISESVNHLYLHDNDISYIADDAFSGLANLRELDLDNNHITMVRQLGSRTFE